jgi:rhodanese-related sulfurtransferase
VLVVDTRDAQDFRREHLPRAISLPYHGFNEHYPQFAASVPKDRPLLLYCYGTDCGLAARVGKRLIAEGYTQVTILRNGIEAWKAANLPLERSEKDNGT